MSTVDDLMALAEEWSVCEFSMTTRGTHAVLKAKLHAALESALKSSEQAAEPVAWLCELNEEDGSTRTMIVQENPEGLRFNDTGEPSPFRVTPLYASPPKREE